MKKLLLLLLLTNFSCTFPDLSDPAHLAGVLGEAIDEERLKQEKRITPYTGWIKRLHDNGQVQLLFKLKGAKLHGQVAGFYKDGALRIIEEYNNGIVDGRGAEWYNNGQQKTEKFSKGGKLNGDFKAWYSNGKQMEEGRYINGLREGLWIHYNETGEVDSRVIFKDGKEQQ